MRWLAGEIAARLIQAIVAWAWLRHLPRALVVPVERVLLACCGAGLFDPEFYCARSPDVAAAGADPLAHFLRHGWAEGRPPNPHFDDGHYRAISGLGAATPVSTLAHYLAVGHRAGLAPVPAAGPGVLERSVPALEVARVDGYRSLVIGTIAAPEEGRPELDSVLMRLDGVRRQAVGPHPVDVVMPVHSGRAETLNAILHALTAANRTAVEIVVVDDATPDAELAGDLDALAARGLITLLRNPANLGFAASINRGTALHPGRDVVWLNADTEVYDHWIDRLRAAAYARADAATVTPLTNNGTICSYPRADADNFGELEMPWRDVDALAAEVNRGVVAEAPTAVGFATYVRRDALVEVGELDAATFGRGYGEENDFCQRAIRAGWVNLLAAGVVVRHFGATSFGGERAGRIQAAMAAMDRLHPAYRADVRAFVERDPLAPARRRLDLARLTAGRHGRTALLVTHSLGGGTAQHVHEETGRLIADGWTVYLLSGGTGGPRTARLARAGAGPLPALAGLELDGDELWQVIACLAPDRIDIHHLIDFVADAPGIFARRLTAAGLSWGVVVHDYFAICPRINMVDRRGRYCGEPGAPGCRRCLTRRGSPAGRPDILDWRSRHGAILRGARRVRVPDDDVARRMARHFPGLRIDTVPHDSTGPGRAVMPPHRAPGPLRIAVIGAIGPIKGIDSVLGLARHAGRRAVRITVIGYTHNDAAARAAGIAVTGAYTNDRVQDLIGEVDPDVIWIPSLWPETYCYTLSIALASGRPVAVFDLGAQAARLRRAGRGTIMPLEDAHRPGRLLAHLRAAARPVDLMPVTEVA